MRPAFFSGFLMMILGCGLAVARMYFLPWHRLEIPTACFYLVRMSAVLGFTVAISGVMLQFASAGIAAGIQLMNMLLGIVITVTAGFVIGPCDAADAACADTTAPVIMVCGTVISLFAALSGMKLAKKA